MPSANVQNLINIAESLVKKRLALRESTPVFFEALANIDDQIRSAINAVVASGEEGELTQQEIFLVNNALSGTRSSLISFEGTYTPDKNDIVGELQDIQKVDFRQLEKLQADDRELYFTLINKGIIIDPETIKK